MARAMPAAVIRSSASDAPDNAESARENSSDSMSDRVSHGEGGTTRPRRQGSASLLGRTISLISGRKSRSKSSTSTDCSDGSSSERQARATATAKKPTQFTIFISCSALIRETMLCVGEESQDELKQVLDAVVSKTLSTESAIKRLVQIAGSTIVQQAGLSVNNAQQGFLPHGWLEYVDDVTGREYFYNVHTRETTWYRPKQPSTLISMPCIAPEDSVNLRTDVNTHHIAISADI